jgi:hypothetical protein
MSNNNNNNKDITKMNLFLALILKWNTMHFIWNEYNIHSILNIRYALLWALFSHSIHVDFMRYFMFIYSKNNNNNNNALNKLLTV